jgi:hypothetical protein
MSPGGEILLSELEEAFGGHMNILMTLGKEVRHEDQKVQGDPIV